MAPIDIHIKHAGKIYDIPLDTDLPPAAFKEAVYQLTGVPVDRMKVMVKGGVLKVGIEITNYGKFTNNTGSFRMTLPGRRLLPKLYDWGKIAC